MDDDDVVSELSPVAATPTMRSGRYRMGYASSGTGSTVTDAFATPVGSSVSEISACTISPDQWQEDAKSCFYCESPLRKMSRHHCRICGRCVCGTCSNNWVQIEGMSGRQRACKSCIASAQKVPMCRSRIAQVGKQLLDLSGTASAADIQDDARTLEDATAMCEAALLPLEKRISDMRDEAAHMQKTLTAERESRQELEEEVNLAKMGLVGIGKRLHAFVDGQEPADIDATAQSCERLLGYCDAAMKPLTQTLTGREGRRLLQRGRPAQQRETQTAQVARAPNGSATSISSGAIARDAWEENSTICSVCGSKIGKRYARRRHHCRVCGKCVCSNCSPSLLVLDDLKKPERVCTPCVGWAQQLPAMQQRLACAVRRLRELPGVATDAQGTSSPIAGSAPGSRLVAAGWEKEFLKLEAALASLEESHGS